MLALCLVAPLLVLLVTTFAYPLARMFWVAFTDPSFGISNFTSFFDSRSSVRALTTTLRVSAIVTVLALAIASIVAWELRTTRSRPKQMLLWSVVLVPLLTSVVTRNYAFTILLQHDGVLNGTLKALHITRGGGDFLYNDRAVAIGILYTVLPFAVLPLYAAFRSIDLDLVRAAQSLGASRARAIAAVVGPLSIPSLLASGSIVFSVSVGFYITPAILGGPSSPFLATVVDRQIYTLFDYPGAAATGTLLFVIALVVIGLAWRAVGYERIQRAVA